MGSVKGGTINIGRIRWIELKGRRRKMAFVQHVLEFKDEPKYTIGERVNIFIDSYNPDTDLHGTGIVSSITTMFLHTPKMRKFTYRIRLDKKMGWWKSECVETQGDILTKVIKFDLC